ncbi:MAG: discoidin domain-containing protein [Prevotella sp.]|nr:discoidin domain-containing protein [Prevotella sp.]
MNLHRTNTFHTQRHAFSRLVMTLTALIATSLVMAQRPVTIGQGSYAEYTPLIKSKTDTHGGDQSQFMQYRKLYIHEQPGQPIPTNDWWTNLITERYSGHLWTYPQFIQAQDYGIDIQWPSYWISDGTEMKSNSVLKIGGQNFHPAAAIAESWHDWDVEFSMQDGTKEMLVTMAHGMPFTWIEIRDFHPQVIGGAAAIFTDASARPLTGTVTTSQLAVRIGSDLYGLFLPQGTEVTIADGTATLRFAGRHQFISAAVIHTAADLDSYAPYAYSVPRRTEVSWQYHPAEGKLTTRWTVSAENLLGKSEAPVLQGFIPHHYRNGATPLFTFNDITYRTPHGLMKMTEGNSFEIDYAFHGMLPYYAAPTDTDTAEHPFLADRMTQMIANYAATGGFGADTYWGGKSLTQMALNMTFAREMGNQQLFTECHDKLKAALTNWLTYTPGEQNFFFARFDRWGGLVGYDTSYDSDTFNDHHFHYGYFTLAGALLALVDDDFRDSYGPMLRLLAKDYANWQRTDTQFPFFRTFDPWAGHSFAGGMGDGNGNGQESSSEAMQGWGGVYLLGVALADDEMRDAGLFGWLSEARGTAEYWFDRHGDEIRPDFHTANDGAYNIDYTKFLHPYNSNLTCHGVGYWTYFGYNSLYMQGIQWMPISPALDYLSEDKAFVRWDYDRMFKDMANGGWLKQDANANGYLGDAGGWGNVALAYYQRSNPAEAAALFDRLWDNNEPEARTINTNGITYFVTHSHLSHGDLDWQSHASIPTARVYRNADGSYTYMAYNPKATAEKVDFFIGGIKTYTMTAAPRQLTVSNIQGNAVQSLFGSGPLAADPRDELEMVNLALHKQATSSSEENAGTLTKSLTDGDRTSRWGSKHADGEWAQVDLGKAARIYKLRLHWEAAYASQYKVQLSTDGTNFTDAHTVSSDGGEDVVMMGDVSARFIRILAISRATTYGVSLYEVEAFGQYESASPTDLLGVKITADEPVLKQGKPAVIHIKGYTCGKQWTDLTPTWSSADGTITPAGSFTPAQYGTATVTAAVNTGGNMLSVSKTFPVEEALRATTLTLTADRTTLTTADKARISLHATDQFKAPMQPELVTITASGGQISLTDSTFTASQPGNYNIYASNGNLKDTLTISVRNFTELNLALGCPATASSQENDGMTARNATDGNASSRWGSAWNGLTAAEADNQQLTVDLQGQYLVNKVIISWEAARAETYDLLVSTDGSHWTAVSHVTCQGGRETVTFPDTAARFIRMQGKTRNMGYGYSIYEMEVYGSRKLNTGGLNLIGTDPVTGADRLSGTWDEADFHIIDSERSAVAYDVREVSFPTGTSFATLNPNCFILISPSQTDAVVNSHNVIVMGNGNTARSIRLTDGQPVDTHLSLQAADATYQRTVNPSYCTLVLPFNADKPSNATLYKLSEARNENGTISLTFQTAEQIEANVPYLVHLNSPSLQASATQAEIAFNEESQQHGIVSFTGNYTMHDNIPASSQTYILKTDSTQPVFYHAAGAFLQAFRAFIRTNVSSGAKMNILFGNATGIQAAETEAVNAIFNVYSLNGQLIRRHTHSLIGLPKGVYIINGRKVIVDGQRTTD